MNASSISITFEPNELKDYITQIDPYSNRRRTIKPDSVQITASDPRRRYITATVSGRLVRQIDGSLRGRSDVLFWMPAPAFKSGTFKFRDEKHIDNAPDWVQTYAQEGLRMIERIGFFRPGVSA